MLTTDASIQAHLPKLRAFHRYSAQPWLYIFSGVFLKKGVITHNTNILETHSKKGAISLPSLITSSTFHANAFYCTKGITAYTVNENLQQFIKIC